MYIYSTQNNGQSLVTDHCKSIYDCQKPLLNSQQTTFLSYNSTANSSKTIFAII